MLSVILTTTLIALVSGARVPRHEGHDDAITTPARAAATSPLPVIWVTVTDYTTVYPTATSLTKSPVWVTVTDYSTVYPTPTDLSTPPNMPPANANTSAPATPSPSSIGFLTYGPGLPNSAPPSAASSPTHVSESTSKRACTRKTSPTVPADTPAQSAPLLLINTRPPPSPSSTALVIVPITFKARLAPNLLPRHDDDGEEDATSTTTSTTTIETTVTTNSLPSSTKARKTRSTSAAHATSKPASVTSKSAPTPSNTPESTSSTTVAETKDSRCHAYPLPHCNESRAPTTLATSASSTKTEVKQTSSAKAGFCYPGRC